MNTTASLDRWLTAFGVLLILCAWTAIYLNLWIIWILPGMILAATLALVRYDFYYYLLFALIPFSVEVIFPNGLGTDLPTEPVMILLSGIFVLVILQDPRVLKQPFFRHPITWLIGCHLFWIVLTSVTSQHEITSLKYMLAKSWYILAFYAFTGLLFSVSSWKKTIRWLGLALLAAVAWVMIRHAAAGFAFNRINNVVVPFFRNHVNYGSLVCLSIPLVAGLAWLTPRGWKRTFWILGTLFLVTAMYLSYTRATYVALMVGIGGGLVLYLKQVKSVLIIGCIVAVAAIGWLLDQNHYLEYAPDYDKTVTYYEFESLLDATAKGQDISTMERVYRWVAGMHMIKERPVFGFGPGNFYNFYKSYTVSSFRTYVSDNPEKSGIHSYYLMTAVEQGIPGALIFLFICFYFLVLSERTFHRLQERETRTIVLVNAVMIIHILTILILNDMVETDKVGPFFFFGLAVLAAVDVHTQREAK
ncbi:MAG: O-antigen ligase family protein [Saprospiraceae bacterium]|nr:O-antigen ligase family protein [Saprospiraceae bacterium]